MCEIFLFNFGTDTKLTFKAWAKAKLLFCNNFHGSYLILLNEGWYFSPYLLGTKVSYFGSHLKDKISAHWPFGGEREIIYLDKRFTTNSCFPVFGKGQFWNGVSNLLNIFNLPISQSSPHHPLFVWLCCFAHLSLNKH